MNDLSKIISQLEHQKSSIERALSALREIGSVRAAGPGAPAGGRKRGRRKKRHLSPEGRQRIIEATKKRWAAKRAADAAAAKKRGAKKA